MNWMVLPTIASATLTSLMGQDIIVEANASSEVSDDEDSIRVKQTAVVITRNVEQRAPACHTLSMPLHV